MISFFKKNHLQAYFSIAALGMSGFLFKQPLLEKISHKIIKYADQYQRRNFPDRIILVRHGESEANITPSLYRVIPDPQVSLTEKGKEQARNSSKLLKQIVGNGPIKFYVSPYLRALQTYENLRVCLKDNKQTMVIDPWLREQELGNFHDLIKNILRVREYVGKYYYRFENGESGADVYNRASLFIDTLFRDLRKMDKKEFDSIVIVCHRWFMRGFITYFFKKTVEEYENIGSP